MRHSHAGFSLRFLQHPAHFLLLMNGFTHATSFLEHRPCPPAVHQTTYTCQAWSLQHTIDHGNTCMAVQSRSITSHQLAPSPGGQRPADKRCPRTPGRLPTSQLAVQPRSSSRVCRPAVSRMPTASSTTPTSSCHHPTTSDLECLFTAAAHVLPQAMMPLQPSYSTGLRPQLHQCPDQRTSFLNGGEALYMVDKLGQPTINHAELIVYTMLSMHSTAPAQATHQRRATFG